MLCLEKRSCTVSDCRAEVIVWKEGDMIARSLKVQGEIYFNFHVRVIF